LPARHFLCELETDLGLSNPSHPPEETRTPQHQSIINKDLPKFVKYISPSSKDETRVWFLRYRDLDMRLASIGMEIVNNIVLPV
jgi:hypothetical protein